MSVQNPPVRQSYYGVTVQVTTTAKTIASLIETVLGLATGSLARIWREVTVQVDPETSAGATVRIGNSNLGATVGGQVQKGLSLVGQSETVRAPFNNVDIGLRYLQTPSGTASVNIELNAQ